MICVTWHCAKTWREYSISDVVRGWNSEVPARPAIVRWLSSKGIRAILIVDLYVTSHLDLVRREQGPGDSHRESVHLTRGLDFVGMGARRPPQEGGAPEVGWIWSMFGAYGLQAAPPTRGE